MASLKRISSQISNPTTPQSARESYFPSTIYSTPHTRAHSYSTTPVYEHVPEPVDLDALRASRQSAAVGHGGAEAASQTSVTSPSIPDRSNSGSIVLEDVPEQKKGVKRKPVPKMLDNDLIRSMEAVEVGHAL
jgi:hypothetical protein